MMRLMTSYDMGHRHSVTLPPLPAFPPTPIHPPDPIRPFAPRLRMGMGQELPFPGIEQLGDRGCILEFGNQRKQDSICLQPSEEEKAQGYRAYCLQSADFISKEKRKFAAYGVVVGVVAALAVSAVIR